MGKRIGKGKNKLLIFSLCFFVISAVIFVISVFNKAFAEGFSRSISYFLRLVLSKLFAVFPFSVAEVLVVLAVPVLVIGLILCVVLLFVKSSRRRNFFTRFLSAVLIVVSIFICTFGVCYFRLPLEENLSIQRSALNRKQLYDCAFEIYSVLDDAADNVEFTDGGASKNPYTFSQTSKLIDDGYRVVCQSYPFISNINTKPKKILLSPLMTYTHISGVYFPITSEANVNTNYPDYVNVFTIAHEKAHQRGIAGEDEANFVGFLACINSGDDYIRYAAYMSMFDYFLDSLYENDIEMYRHFIEGANDKIFGEMKAYSDFFDKYRDSVSSKVSDKVNDTYIKIMGQEGGTKNYGKVVELYCAYFN